MSVITRTRRSGRGPLGPRRSRPSEDELGEVLFASHLLGANRALANYGGGNTSAKGTAIDHVGREVAGDLGQGLRQRPGDDDGADFTPLRLDEILPLFEREQMSDEEMVAHLARCQLDPAAPRSSIETLLHAFVPAAHVHHTHPDAINVLACSATAGADRGVLRRRGRLDRVHPPGLHARQAGGRGRPRQSGACGSWCSASTAWSSGATAPRRRTSGRSGLQPGGRVRQPKVARAAAIRRPERACPGLDDDGAGDAPRDAADAARRGLPRAGEGADRRSVGRCARVRRLRAGSGADAVGAACPDHLVHTKRVPLWVPYDPATDTLRRCRSGSSTGARRYRDELRSLLRRATAEPDGCPDPDPAWC